MKTKYYLFTALMAIFCLTIHAQSQQNNAANTSEGIKFFQGTFALPSLAKSSAKASLASTI